MNQTSKNIPGLMIDREGLINMVQMHTLTQLVAVCEDPLTSGAEAELAREGIAALVKEIEDNVPRGNA
jgi:hypothetical protein